jgi:hypothetical protein
VLVHSEMSSWCAAQADCAIGGHQVGGCSSAGRAPRSQRGGQRFDPAQLHQIEVQIVSEILEVRLIAGFYFFLFLEIYVCEAEGFLAVVLDLQLVLIEFDLAYRRQLASTFAILVDIKHKNAELIVRRASGTIKLAK